MGYFRDQAEQYQAGTIDLDTLVERVKAFVDAGRLQKPDIPPRPEVGSVEWWEWVEDYAGAELYCEDSLAELTLLSDQELISFDDLMRILKAVMPPEWSEPVPFANEPNPDAAPGPERWERDMSDPWVD